MTNPALELDPIWLFSPDIMLAADAAGSIEAVNPAWSSLLGWLDSDLAGLNFLDLVHPEDRTSMAEAIVHDASTPKSSRIANRIRRKDGSYAPMDWSLVVNQHKLYAIGRCPGSPSADGEHSAATSRNKALDQRIDMLGGFAAVVAHDFNNLLQGIVGSMDLVRKLVEQDRAAEAVRFMTSAMTASRRAAMLTERLHTFSNRQPFDPHPLDVSEVLGAMEAELRKSLTEMTTLALSVSPDLRQAQGHRGQLERAVTNLVANSRNALPAGGVITLKASNHTVPNNRTLSSGSMPPGDYICIAVTDCGTGMSAEAVRQAFDPMFTGRATGMVSGLGLAMVYLAMRQMRGHIDIDSEIGRGTTVSLYLPALPDISH